MEPIDRLRRLQALRPARTSQSDILKPREGRNPLPDGDRRAVAAYNEVERRSLRLEDLVPGEEWENEAGVCYVATTTYALDGAALLDAQVAPPLHSLLAHTPTLIAPFHPDASPAAPVDFRKAAFLDTETTGLGGAAGIYAFMVGVATFEERFVAADEAATGRGNGLGNGVGERQLHYVVRQLFMRSPAEELALLVALAELLQGRDLLVTFNGRSFDVPLLRTRYLFNRRFLPDYAQRVPLFGDLAPHLDLLHPARRLWKRRLQSCRLINLESQVLGRTRTQDDVSGALIPQMYVDYVRSGNGWDMGRVFYHNREDIVSTGVLAAQLCQVFQAPDAPESGVTALEWLALGEYYERASNLSEAEHAFQYALDALVNDGSHSEAARSDAFRRLARVQKRAGNWDAAAATWELWLTTIQSADVTPFVELAKLHEWRHRDFVQAAMWTAWGIHTIRTLPAWQRVPGQLADLEQRLARLDKRLAKS